MEAAEYRVRTYREFFDAGARPSDDFSEFFRAFLHRQTHPEQRATPRITLVRLPREDYTPQDEAELFSDLAGLDDLARELNAADNPRLPCRLFIVENIDADSAALLGGTLNIDFQFFTDFINTSSWVRTTQISPLLPALASVQKRSPFACLRFVGARTLEYDQFPSKIFVHPDEGSILIERVAGKLKPLQRRSESPQTLALVRQFVGVWFGRGDYRSGWDGVILLDPEFRPEGHRRPLRPEYRAFSARPTNQGEQYPRDSSKQAFCSCLEQEQDLQLFRIAIQNPFAILRDLFRIMASEWIALIAYIQRELVTIEIRLERKRPSLDNLEVQLQSLFEHRRRIFRYKSHVREAAKLCEARGQPSWPRNEQDVRAFTIASDLREDLKEVEALIEENIQRVLRDINVLTALIALEEGRQGTEKNKGIARLTTIATIFVPFATIATIMGMGGDYGPDKEHFWMFWLVAVLVMMGTVLTYFVSEEYSKWKRG